MKKKYTSTDRKQLGVIAITFVPCT